MEPRDAAKGNIARAIVYRHYEYHLPIVGALQMYKEWHRMDPPDAEEQARNDKIANRQGTLNNFIDDPARVDSLIKNQAPPTKNPAAAGFPVQHSTTRTARRPAGTGSRCRL
ncbi:endonuclease [Pseudomonas sp. SJZ079]|uniref:endonuclease n=1 Tax=Pseudomonas sp. SJZ079 TaxID=2572887 RepID=UPI002115C548|nr:endonuclease [Pseudomonas sp. SJZ079]